MYYLLNQTKQIIAADEGLLTVCGVSHIDELSSKIILGETILNLTEETLSINDNQNYAISKTSLSSMLGDLTLVTLTMEDVVEKNNVLIDLNEEDFIKDFTEEDTYEDLVPLDLPASDIDDDLLFPENETKEDVLIIPEDDDFILSKEERKEDVLISPQDDDLLFPKEETKENEQIITEDDDLLFSKEETKEDVLISPQDDDLLFSKEETKEDVLISPQDDDFLFPKEETKENAQIIPEDTEEIFIDIENISQEIGVSHEDYNAFVDEYIDTALGLELDLQSEDTVKCTNAIAILSQLGDLLRLPVINAIIGKLSTASKNDQKEIITSFYNTLSRLTTQKTPRKEVLKEEEEGNTPLELFDMPLVEPELSEEIKPKKDGDLTSFGTINLEGIKPIHFDFQLEEAASDLSLPVELIEEFVNDFIEQGHIETKKILEAYEEGDLDAIQKIGHLLKGASSNLRINALSDTLYQIQFCEDPSNLEAFIKEYWGHFLSFEIQINALAK